MKTTLNAIATIMVASPLAAGGYTLPTPDSPPIVVRETKSEPINWGGMYGGVSANRWNVDRTKVHEREMIEKKVWRETDPEDMFPGCHYGNNTCPVQVGTDEWGSPVWLYEPVPTDSLTDEDMEWVRGDSWLEQITESFSASTNGIGLFAGYRHQFNNNVVAGVEGSYSRLSDFDENAYNIEGQLGYAVNNLLPYVSAGYGRMGDYDGWVAGVGIDVAINEHFIIGAKFTHGEYDNDIKADNFGIRFGMKF